MILNILKYHSRIKYNVGELSGRLNCTHILNFDVEQYQKLLLIIKRSKIGLVFTHILIQDLNNRLEVFY